jgi:hypothetical protein
MLLKIVLISLLTFITCKSIPPNCLVRDNFLFHWNITKDVYIFQIAAPTNFVGWAGIGFSTTNTTKDSHMFVAYRNNSELILNQYYDHYTLREAQDFQNFQEVSNLLPSKFVSFQFEIDEWNMPDNEYVFFAYNDEITPLSPLNLTKHNYVKILKINLNKDSFDELFITF